MIGQAAKVLRGHCVEGGLKPLVVNSRLKQLVIVVEILAGHFPLFGLSLKQASSEFGNCV
jgi:hypothetical protein